MGNNHEERTDDRPPWFFFYGVSLLRHCDISRHKSASTEHNSCKAWCAFFICAALNKAVSNDESVAQFVVGTRTLFPSHLDIHTRIDAN